MVIYRFPPESDGKQEPSSDKHFEGKTPDFIYVDEQRPSGEKMQGSFSKKSFDVGDIGKNQNLGILRFLALVVALALTVWICILSIVFLIASAGAALLLFQDSPARKLAQGTWKLICRLSAFALAFFVATLSPGFGFGILALYAMQHGENWQTGTFGKIFSNRFN